MGLKRAARQILQPLGIWRVLQIAKPHLKTVLRPVVRKIRELRRAFFPLRPTHTIGDEEFAQHLHDAAAIGNARNFAAHLRSRRKPVLFSEHMDREQLRQAWQALGTEACAQIVRQADAAVRHEFDLLGSGPVNLGGTIDWQRDFISAERWELAPIDELPTVKEGGGSDIKVPWELSRFYHAPVLGIAYLLTGERKYAREFREQIISWIAGNPVEFSANWKCAMEAAIRAGNWVAALPFMLDDGALPDDFLHLLGKSLWEHGMFIRSHLEGTIHLRSNHYLADLQGLLYIGLAFPEFKESDEWRAFAVQELEREIQWEVYEDGADFEASSAYHRLCLELFFGPAVLCRANGIALSAAYQERLKKMFSAVLAIMDRQGHVPLIGDNDSGRLHWLLPREDADFSYLLAIGAAYFGEPAFRLPEAPFPAEGLLLLGPSGAEEFRALAASEPARESAALPDTGWYVIRQGEELLHVICGPNGQRFRDPAPGMPNWNGGHAHNDKLSICYQIGDRPVLVDPGQYCYTADAAMRNHSRGTASHNTVQIDQAEQQEYLKGYLFNIYDERARPTVLAWNDGASAGRLFAGEHHGYVEYAGLTHRRTIARRNGGGFLITDELIPVTPGLAAGKRMRYHFHLAPGVYPTLRSTNEWVLGDNLAGLRFSPKLAADIELVEDFVAPGYGRRVPAFVLCLDLCSVPDRPVSFEIFPR